MQRAADVTTELHSAVQQLNTEPCVCVCVSLLIINTVSFVTSGTKQNNRAETPTTHTHANCSVYFTVTVGGKKASFLTRFSQI